MRARPLTLAVASLPALASFPEAPVGAKLSGRPLPQAIPLRTACPTLPLEIATLLDRAMAHDPRVRPTAKDRALALKDAADRLTQ